jgi:sugar phosphate isomerase/epimerase
MKFSLSTAWNASRHRAGETMVDEIRAAGFDRMELGYGLTLDLLPGIRKMTESGAVSVGSVHAVCPVPLGTPWSAAGAFQLCDADNARRDTAVRLVGDTIRFAAEFGASVVVAHAGDVDMTHRTDDLIRMYMGGHSGEPAFEKARMNLMVDRERRARPAIERLHRSIEALLSVLESSGVRLALEILPYWESVPTEMEMLDLLTHFNSPWLGYWHDIGHGQVRQNLGFIGVRLWMRKLDRWLLGMHIHDVTPPAGDHIAPGKGSVRFEDYRDAALKCEPVIEVNSTVSAGDIRNATEYLRKAWDPSALK